MKKALLVVDYTVDFVADDGRLTCGKPGQAIEGAICKLTEKFLENDDFIVINGCNNDNSNKYVVMIDPLDGSSNIDVNVSVGTIFSIYRRISQAGTPVEDEDIMQKGKYQVAAGYVLYGSSTMLVYTTGHGVNGFTYDVTLGEFFLSHTSIVTPQDGNIYSINEGMYHSMPESVKAYIEFCKKEEYCARYIGSLVADFHRNLFKGGIYIYPTTKNNPQGKSVDSC